MGIQSVEQGIERMVDGVFKRSRNTVRPIEIGRRLLREMDDQRTIDAQGNRVVPNAFDVTLSDADYDALSDIESMLCSELAEAVKEYARDENYNFMGPVSVSLHHDSDLKPGRFGVSSDIRVNAAAATGARAGYVITPSGERIALNNDQNLIGRLADCVVIIPDSNTSRHHARITRTGNGYAVADLGSTNGTFVNGDRVTEERVLHDGDTITVGTVALQFEAS